VSDAPYQPNNHTDNELYLLDLTTNGTLAEIPSAVVLLLSVALLFSQKSSFFHYQQRFLARSAAALSLRGPPVWILIK
jgi:hypothetical protein